jgi:hypothetical protein
MPDDERLKIVTRVRKFALGARGRQLAYWHSPDAGVQAPQETLQPVFGIAWYASINPNRQSAALRSPSRKKHFLGRVSKEAA